jgi:hypothetical protein
MSHSYYITVSSASDCLIPDPQSFQSPLSDEATYALEMIEENRKTLCTLKEKFNEEGETMFVEELQDMLQELDIEE